MVRLESPSSINTFLQCKRKYYYSYKLNLPRKESISTITGKAVHSTLENFFKIDVSAFNNLDIESNLKHHLLNLFNKFWTDSLPELLKLGNDKDTIRMHYRDSISMLNNFIEDFLAAFKNLIKKSNMKGAFERLKPQTEVYLYSEKHKVHGYLDAVFNIDNEIYILDYKTSSKNEITDDYMLQLGIYSLMFHEKHGVYPNKVGLHFLRHGTKKYIDVSESLIEKARRECELIQFNTVSDNLEHYEKNPGPLCKWKTGQCSFYDICYSIKRLDQFDENKFIQIRK